VSDTHSDGEFGIAKVTVSQDTDETVCFMLDQVNARHVDETMLGNYNYIPVKFMVSKVVNKADGPSAVFIDGSYDRLSTQTISFPYGIAKGEYLLTYSGAFTNLHPERKMVVSVHSQVDCSI